MSRRKVLVVDDDAAFDILKNRLTRDGRAVVMTRKLNDVVDLIRKEQPDVVVCDMDFNDSSGVAVAQMLATDEVARKVPFLVLSSYSDIRRIDEMGLNGIWVVSKWSGIDTIVSRIETAMSASQTH